jgi:hypothetical protein
MQEIHELFLREGLESDFFGLVQIQVTSGGRSFILRDLGDLFQLVEVLPGGGTSPPRMCQGGPDALDAIRNWGKR